MPATSPASYAASNSPAPSSSPPYATPSTPTSQTSSKSSPLTRTRPDDPHRRTTRRPARDHAAVREAPRHRLTARKKEAAPARVQPMNTAEATTTQRSLTDGHEVQIPRNPDPRHRCRTDLRPPHPRPAGREGRRDARRRRPRTGRDRLPHRPHRRTGGPVQMDPGGVMTGFAYLVLAVVVVGYIAYRKARP